MRRARAVLKNNKKKKKGKVVEAVRFYKTIFRKTKFLLVKILKENPARIRK